MTRPSTPTPTFPALTPDDGGEPPPFAYYVPFPEKAIADPALTDLDVRILLVVVSLSRGKDRNGLDCTASTGEIAGTVGRTVGATQMSLKRLEGSGYLRRSTDRSVQGNFRRISLTYRTWDPDLDTVRKHRGAQASLRPPLIPACAPAQRRKRQGASQLAPPLIPACAPPPIGFEKEEKPSKGATVLSHEGEGETTVAAPPPPAEADEPRAPAEPEPEDLEPLWREWLNKPGLREIAVRRLRQAGKLPLAEPGPEPDPASGPDPAPAAPLDARTLPPASSAYDGAWSALMATAPADPPRREAGHAHPPRGLGEAERLARAFAEDHADATLDALVRHLCSLWRDHKVVTRRFWLSGLSEIRTGRLAVDEVVGLIRDAGRREVSRHANHFSDGLGDTLRRSVRKEPAVGCVVKQPRRPARANQTPELDTIIPSQGGPAQWR